MIANYIEKVYAGWLGKLIGIRAGANIEGWSCERIARVYGVLNGYPVHYDKLFAADDDSNGPMFFLRALTDYTFTRDITPNEIGLTLLNYAAYEKGFFWWGGYGKSTEHTAYLNLRSGIKAPRSGSIEQNGPTVAEQIGGQIFIDTWGLICPGAPDLAAEYAAKAAGVTHGGNGIYGGQFIAACISEAFVNTNIRRVIEAGLTRIPADCLYVKMARDVIGFYENNPADWKAAFAFVKANYGYDKYGGGCHIIPNSAVIILALLYGGGRFDDSINICNMCGWDTDCNVANVGTIVGVMNGLSGIDYKKWRAEMNDNVVFATVMGSMNLSDAATNALYIASFGYKVMGETPPAEWADYLSGDAPKFNFKLPGSTQGMLCDNPEYTLTNENGALKVSVSRKGETLRVYRPTYLRPDAFYDSRYDPSLSPTAYPGYGVTCKVYAPDMQNGQARLYALDVNSGVEYFSDAYDVSKDWTLLNFTIPHIDGGCIGQVGVRFEDTAWQSGGGMYAYITDLDFRGQPDYTIDFAKERVENWSWGHQAVSQCSIMKGIWKLEDGQLSGSCADEGAIFTGDYAWRDIEYSVDITPKTGGSPMALIRVQGAIRGYAAALSEHGLALYKNENGLTILAKEHFKWHTDKTYTLHISAKGDTITASVEGVTVSARDLCYAYGAIGFGVNRGCHSHFSNVIIK